ncbi:MULTISPECIES: hypothetical protein [unclassified Mucilaginibacter]|uniref:hypothetical protein n=1 Tax=unclassified Mucilaginibacter TaxID=2617802 RepID=UPI002AC97E00|nr:MULTISPECIES: hypothetical protein [unclassified Mucilaginibacter]MEB0261082.1 hypothetical protein [Mucilaginibacter sp. 10I4]MEB0278755.1 hypothetical protein [Mucilaginibacter sp. 10B2]MEB0301711.1 hypothetical protein [Mucilaginibacter sp. 5C4]WPX23293.1 hypothetical protein RHM67_18620 [Mucilaginibacter sp. 5C4]
MKKALLMISLIACLASCKKDNPVIPTLNGKWELHSVTGGFGPGQAINTLG